MKKNLNNIFLVARNNLNLTMKEVSDKSGVSIRIVNSIENELPANYTLETINKICKVLNIDVSEAVVTINSYKDK